jgi:hypothetical protein
VWPLAHPGHTAQAERAFRHAFLTFLQQEQQIAAAQAALGKLNKQHEITDGEWGRRMLQDILPRWKAAEDQLAAAELPEDSRFRPVRAEMLDYLDEKRTGLKLVSEGSFFNSRSKLQEGERVLAASERKLDMMKPDLRDLAQ